MITKNRLLSCLLAGLVPAGMVLWAAEPAATPTTGHVLVLDNEGTLEGDIERVGDQYRVRRRVGETWVPATKALALCNSAVDAYAYLRERSNLNDPDERLRLAHWCHLHDLREQALAEVKAAVALRPQHANSRRLLSSLQQSAAMAKAESAAEKPVEPETAPPPDLTADALCTFNTRVQPILMNACANCHTAGRGGAFQLTRIYEDTGASRKTVQHNLAAVLAQINLERPQGSPLLTKAVSPHDGQMAQAPLKGRQSEAYRALESWVQQTLADNPQLHERTGAAVTPAPAPTKTEAAFAVESTTAKQAPMPEPATAAPMPKAPTSPASAVDPFDPSAFNRQMHPERKPEGAK
jgi:hypothetical protein